MRRQFGARMRGLVAVLAAAVTLTLLPSGPSQAQSAGGTWATKAPMLTVRTNPGVTTASNGKIYAIGGGNATSGYVSANEEYDAASNSWTARAPMPTPRQGLGVAAAANGKLYAIGGIGFVAPTPASTVVEEYDPATNMWAPRAAMPTGRAALGLAAAPNGKLYAMGGYNDSGALATVEEYDPATNSWAAKAPMPTPRLGLAVAAASNGKLYAIGGFRNGDGSPAYAVEEYDPSANVWGTKASLPTGRYYLGVAPAPNGKLYAIGGIDSRAGANSAANEEYDPATNTWTPRSPMPTARAGLGVATAPNGKLYAIGGYDSSPYPNNYSATVEEFDPTTIGSPPPSADLTVSQTDSADPVAIGSALTYTVVARNNGPLSATGVTLTDTLPTGVNFVSVTASQGTCSGTTTLTCALGSLANGTSATVTINVKPTAAGPLTNAAAVSGNEADPNSANNTSIEGTTVLTTADLSRLTVAVEGQGRVTSSPAGIDCHPSSCVANYGPGASISLTAAAEPGWRFDHWDRACQGQASSCNLTLGTDLLVKAVFVRAR